MESNIKNIADPVHLIGSDDTSVALYPPHCAQHAGQLCCNSRSITSDGPPPPSNSAFPSTIVCENCRAPLCPAPPSASATPRSYCADGQATLRAAEASTPRGVRRVRRVSRVDGEDHDAAAPDVSKLQHLMGSQCH